MTTEEKSSNRFDPLTDAEMEEVLKRCEGKPVQVFIDELLKKVEEKRT